MEERQTGLAEGTLVHGPKGKRPAQELATGDQVWSHDCELGEWLVTNVRRLVSRCVKTGLARLQAGGSSIDLAFAQPVWAESPAGAPGSWVQARNLAAGDRVLSLSGPLLVERNDPVEGEEVTLVELETSALHSYAAGAFGILVHNRVPALAVGQVLTITVQATGAQVQFTLPPIEWDHVFRGFFRAATVLLEGLHHVPAPHAIPPGGVITVANHTIVTTNAAGGQVTRIVDLRLTPVQGLVVTGDAPFEARVEVIDPATNGVIARKNNSSFFPMNWRQDQVVQAIYEAATNYVRVTGNLPVGRTLPADTDAGVRMLLHTRAPAGVPVLISTGYPRGAQPAVTAAHVPLL